MPSYLDLIDHKTTGNRCDVTPLFADATGFAALLDDLQLRIGGASFDLVAGIDALGFILGAALAARYRVGFLPVRKGGKLPVAAESRSFVDYTGETKTLEIRRDAIVSGIRVLVVDEWIETGAQVSAAIDLIASQGGIVIGVASIQADRNERTQPLREKFPFYIANDE